MAVQTGIARPVRAVQIGLLGTALIAATVFGAGIGLWASPLLAPVARPAALTQAAPVFDTSAFRLGEKQLVIRAAPAFDASAFRLGEKQP